MEIMLGNQKYIPNRIFCIGRNYVAHARELNNEVPESPVVFMKSPDCLVPSGQPVEYPPHGEDLQHEAEIVLLIGKSGKCSEETLARDYIAGLSLGLDLTLRDIQTRLKQKGLPWESAKSFENSAPIGRFIELDETLDLNGIQFNLKVNGELRQQGNSGNMIFKIPRLLVELSKIWSFKPGDLIFTGTPAGVSALQRGDNATLEGELFGEFRWNII